MHTLLIFLDGFGLGENDPSSNPFLYAQTPNFDRLLGGKKLTRDLGMVATPQAVMVPTDTCLGVDGLPQSATGQTTLFTGINAAKVIGRHLNAYPRGPLVELLTKDNIFLAVKKNGGATTFANAYRPDFFQAMEQGKAVPRSATTVAALAAGLRLRTIEDLLQGQAVYHDIIRLNLLQRGYQVPIIKPEEAGEHLAGLVTRFTFTMFEHFMTDMVGHSQDLAQAIAQIEIIDRFLGGVMKGVDLKETTIIVTSDHGNLEDITVKTHTRNKVPTLLIGKNKEMLAPQINSLSDLKPALELLWSLNCRGG